MAVGPVGLIWSISHDALLNAEIVVANFHALGAGGEDDLLSKLGPDDIDSSSLDEAYIAAAESYQRLFTHFPWIEILFGVDPDRGRGALEWAIVIALATGSVAFGLLARTEWRQAAGRRVQPEV